ncbi:MAG: Mut7-C RNAse domain-containing protein [Candidatus Brocadiia bacterium]
MAQEPTFYCDAMLGGLARWLRAAGYDTEFDAHVRDGALVRRCLEQGRWLLTSDSGMLERYAITEGLVQHVFVPRGQPPVQQLAYVMGELELELRAARCMDCNGELVPVELDEVAAQVPPRAREAYEEFFRCAGCGKVYWRGTHWEDISRKLNQAAGREG